MEEKSFFPRMHANETRMKEKRIFPRTLALASTPSRCPAGRVSVSRMTRNWGEKELFREFARMKREWLGRGAAVVEDLMVDQEGAAPAGGRENRKGAESAEERRVEKGMCPCLDATYPWRISEGKSTERGGVESN